tara:strand:- start:289 stop:603 length:315 start_codon:yes stop_codon:yes gene_type:complete
MTNTKKIFEILSKDKLTVRDLLHIQYMTGERIVPIDVVNNEYERHFSKNKQEYEDILDMDLTHLVRAYSKYLETKRLKNDETASKIGELLTDADRIIHKVRTLL